jgi:cysteinyl-tRNA synthetase
MGNKIFIHNSLTRKKEEFIPLKPNEVKMYVCGPTVYDAPHLGHARSAYIFDVVRRYLTYRGYKVKFARNVTDVDDKIISKAQAEFKEKDLNSAVKEVSAKYLDLYHEDMKSLGILDPDVEPKATEYVCPDKPLMQKFIQQLIDKGSAYVAEGDVYFDIKKAKNYGKLSNQALEKMEAGARIALGEKKRDPLDFALWKSAKPNEPSWDSPWGRGRPGWHIECSVMSSDILGDEFDIHGGGIDLIFPHHENEIAQSEGAGKKFARYWMHHGLLTINGQKMSKSLGNFVTVRDFLAKYKNADLLKLLFLSTHYLHPVDYTDEKVQEARQALERIVILADKIGGKYSQGCGKQNAALDAISKKFIAAMDDNFNAPEALAQIFELVSAANRNIDDAVYTAQAWVSLKELTGIFGIDLDKLQAFWGIGSKDENIDELINLRQEAKGRRDFGEADRIRKKLEAEGIILEDTKDGTTWRRKL